MVRNRSDRSGPFGTVRDRSVSFGTVRKNRSEPFGTGTVRNRSGLFGTVRDRSELFGTARGFNPESVKTVQGQVASSETWWHPSRQLVLLTKLLQDENTEAVPKQRNPVQGLILDALLLQVRHFMD